MHEPAPDPQVPLDVDLDLSRWREYDDIITESLWLLGARDNSGVHSPEYWGNFVPQIPNQIVRRFTTRRELVLDLFSGLGTTVIESTRLGRHSLGVDLNEQVVQRSRELVEQTPNPYGVRWEVVAADSTRPDLPALLAPSFESVGKEFADCVLLHPPYHNIISFSDDPRDLSACASQEEFLEGFRRSVRNAFAMLAPDRHMALVIGDRYAQGEWVPLGFECMRVCQQEGFTLKAINVKDIQGNERGKGRNGNLWRYRALKQGLYIFSHEYVMVFRKDYRKVRGSGVQ